MTAGGGYDTFPAPVYSETVLAPLFETAKAHYAQAFRAIDEAHCLMLARTGILRPEEAGAIAAALLDIEAELDLSAQRYDGSVEDFFFLVERELKARLGADLGGRLHTGRSRNDMDHTAFKIVLRGRIDALAGKMLRLAEVLLAKARVERDTLIVAYTHGQPAQPSTFGHYLAAVLEVVLRDLRRLLRERETVDLCPMGAAAITTSGFPLDRRMMAELLGFAAPLRNSYGCIAAIDYVTGSYAALRLAMLHLGRPIQDMQVWSSFEVGQIRVPDGLVQISSIMPQKRNPVPIEHLRLLASLAGGRAEGIVQVMHNTPFTDMNDGEAEVQSAGYAAFTDAGRVLDLMAGVIEAVSIDSERVARTTGRSCIAVTELADTLVRAEGLSFRQGHEIAAAVSRAVMAGGGTSAEAGYPAFAQAFRAHVGREPTFAEAAFREAVSPRHFVAVRDRLGGPAPAAMDEALAVYAGEIAELRAMLARQAATLEAAASARRQAFAAVARDRRG